MDTETVAGLISDGVFSQMDIHFAKFMESLEGADPLLFKTAALISSQTRQGNVCLDLNITGNTRDKKDPDPATIPLPDKETWLSSVKQWSVVGAPGEYKPIILEDDRRLYLYRYWEYQDKLASFIRKRSSILMESCETGVIKGGIDKIFPENVNTGGDRQKLAAAVTCLKQFSVITGGPGTGKTTTVTRILAILIELSCCSNNDVPLKILLAAPTGKAAARLRESISAAKKQLDVPEHVLGLIPEKTCTIHRMLGSISGSSYFRYNEKRKLNADIVVIDEASMVDLALMSKLTQAIPEHARLILLGDQDQLASVEAGAVLGDICNAGKPPEYSIDMKKKLKRLSVISGTEFPDTSNEDAAGGGGINDCITILDKSYRFKSGSGIRAVSEAATKGSPELFISIAMGSATDDVSICNLPLPDDLKQSVRDTVIKGFRSFLEADTLPVMFQNAETFKVLTAVRKGRYGVESVNIMIEQILAEEGLINPADEWYPGRPVMITQNDYSLGLFNGDLGVVVSTGNSRKELTVCFPDGKGGARHFHVRSLPAHETAYALTVHKSQGSEFSSILFILPDYEAPVLTRELVYTAVTRAREEVVIMGNPSVIQFALNRKTVRMSGLRYALWENSSELVISG